MTNQPVTIDQLTETHRSILTLIEEVVNGQHKVNSGLTEAMTDVEKYLRERLDALTIAMTNQAELIQRAAELVTATIDELDGIKVKLSQVESRLNKYWQEK